MWVIINLLTYQKQHQFSHVHQHNNKSRFTTLAKMNTLQSSEKGICHDQKTKQIENEQYILKQKS